MIYSVVLVSGVNQPCVHSPVVFLVCFMAHCIATVQPHDLDFLGYSECLACQKPVISPKPLTGLETPAVEIPASSLALPLKNDIELEPGL